MPNLLFSTIIESVMTEVDYLLDNFIYDGYQALSSYLEVPLGIAIVLYIIFYGYSMVMGWSSVSIQSFSKSIVKISLIYTFAMHWSWFSEYFVRLLFDVSGHIGDVIVSSSTAKLPSFSKEGVNGALQSVLIELWKLGQWTWDGGSFTAWGPLFSGLALWVCGFLLVGIAVFEIIYAKCMLSILCVLAPLFISFTLFSATREFFNRWLGLCASFSFLLIMILAVVALSMSIDQWAVADAYISKGVNIPMLGFLTIIFVSLICVGLVRKVEMLALTMGSFVGVAISQSSIAQNISGFLGGSFSGARDVMRFSKYAGGKMSGFGEKSNLNQKGIHRMRMLLAKSRYGSGK